MENDGQSGRPVPRPIEFMLLGYSVGQMRKILNMWQDLSDQDIQEIGFTISSPEREAGEKLQQDSRRRKRPFLSVVPSDSLSDQDSEL
jgi:hypothetical protein